MATFVVHMHMSPTEYRNLTLIEREVLVQEFNKANKRRR